MNKQYLFTRPMSQPNRRSLMLLLLGMAILSCQAPTGKDVQVKGADSSQQAALAPGEEQAGRINAAFPFGCMALAGITYPMHWEADPDHYGHLIQPAGKSFEDIGSCFYELHQGKTIQAPKPAQLKRLSIGNLFTQTLRVDTSLQWSIDSCRYRLPNLGDYACYYSYAHYGNLWLYNPHTSQATVFTVYADDIPGDGTTLLRYFYIDQQVIHILDAYYSDGGCTLYETARVRVNGNGAITVEELRPGSPN